jgi:hypothetical protein
MIDALIAGKLHGKPAQKTGQSGKAFVTTKVRAQAGNGETVGAALLALDDGDSVALSGALTPKAWIDRQGEAKPALDLVAHTLATAYTSNASGKRLLVIPMNDFLREDATMNTKTETKQNTIPDAEEDSSYVLHVDTMDGSPSETITVRYYKSRRETSENREETERNKA